MENNVWKYEFCSRCGSWNKIIKCNKYLDNVYCKKCGKILIKGKYGGKSDYDEYLKTEHWKITKRLTLEHYKNVCAVCGTDKKLNVHHITYENKGKEKLEDLQILCERHHKETHNIENGMKNE